MQDPLTRPEFDLGAEYGPSLFDARHRFVASGTWQAPRPGWAPPALASVLADWQINAIATHNSGTPFTVSDSANVALQANSPPISGFPASRPNLVGDPNGGPHTVDAWVSRSAFQRLDLATQAGQFGNAGRNIVRGPGYTNVDASLVRTVALGGRTQVQFRWEIFNVINKANFNNPTTGLNSSNFGRILSAGDPRIMQFGFKFDF